MAIIRHLDKNDNTINYIGTIGFFCVISCTIIMLKFRGFKASLSFGSGKSSGIEHYDISSTGVSINGAYRTNKDDLFGSVHYTEPSKRISTSMVKLPSDPTRQLKTQSKSTTDLSNPANAGLYIKKSAPAVPQVPQPSKNSLKEEKKLEKQRVAVQKRQEKLAEKERQREEKLRKDREKQLQETRVDQNRNIVKKSKKRAAPQPQQKQQISQSNVPSNSQVHKQAYSTDTMSSSISKSSGPPPYSTIPKVIPNINDDSGNTSFAKPINDMDSWDLISQHRQQMNRQAGATRNIPKQTHLDLQYTVGSTRDMEKENSAA